MEQEPSISWPGQLQEESIMTNPGDDEFTNFLEFGMQFPDLEGHGPGNHERHPASSLPSTVSLPPSTAADQNQMVHMDTEVTAQPSPYNRIMDNISLDLHSQGQAQPPSGQVPPSYSNAAMTPGFYAQESLPHQPFQHPQQQSQDHSHPPSHYQSLPPQSTRQYCPQGQPMIPPTPNSMELHGNAARYPQRVDENHEMYDRYTRMNDEQILYTPLISPAMTPLETQFRLPEYTIPGEYFTPLTSPALEAQNSNANNYPFHSTQQQVSDVGFLHSPVDTGIPAASTPNSPGIIRKHRRRPSATSRFASRAKKQQSPSVRPQTRKKSLLNVNSDEVLNGLSQDQGGSKPRANGGSSLRYGSNESSQDSVSPEPLSEPLMPPPALPQSRKSPAMGPQSTHSQAGGAATPAMLMRIQRSQHDQDPTGQFTGQAKLVPGESHDDIMEDVVLPEAVTPTSQLSRPQVARIETATPADTTTASVKLASATPSLEPKSAPILERNPSSIAPSPRTIAMPSPSGPVGKKSDTPKIGPIGRKRPSLSHASPQLRPKISPSIQPLVRGDAGSGETSALYLASKSNYQHILDGTLLPGVSYPETLAENLSSKRTNHKLAEQGRRNRINNALKEIETLIPAGFVQLKNAKEAAACNARGAEKEKDKAGNQAISKASTVEMAIDYIKALRKELEETQGKLAAAESRLSGKESEANSSSAEGNTVTKNTETEGVSGSPKTNDST
ncbi:hypothetical protein ASPWEDRAFT_604837 [Aspergillus wentii DTO 134E9]|uniref:BHLH domain-containing protein n=1 Tax=Aspergillus wentii DTO 134E9 TaxID=1073089 RepID=A0A1L9RDR1_ASPWE|nr:uncharacterized protein ASPWEDRAFT_604837 [Aspergillus wentii DTO 134E9]OJJ33079.1 hypothetical protein ASPWEDRAFT_604837 [Aspergillus wentii DTO 134E9]